MDIMSVLVEICTGSVEDVLESEKGGAHRVELCSALALGGLTPSIATVLEANRLSSLPIMVMIRPRSGGFCYSEVEFTTMERDLEAAAEAGADGFVFGVLQSDGVVDAKRTARLVKIAAGMPTVFHRAFDVTPDPFEALSTLIDLGIRRVLTSGQEPSSPNGVELIRELVAKAGDRLEIMPGSGVRVHNVAELVRTTGCRQVHLSAHKSYVDSSTLNNPRISFGSPSPPQEGIVNVIDFELVAAIVQAASVF